MSKLLLMIIFLVLILISCDSTTKPIKQIKIYGTLVDSNDVPIPDAEICALTEVPSWMKTNKISVIYDQPQSKILVVELQYFNIELVDGYFELKWATDSEFNCDRFELLRAEHFDNLPLDFKTLATVKAKGNSIVTTNYAFVDSNLKNNTTYSYKLKIIDLDGSSTESGIIRFVNQEIPTQIGTNFPNPFINQTIIPYNLAKSDNVTLKVIEKSTGIEYFNATMFNKSGQYNFSWTTYLEPTNENSAILRPGIYNVTLTTGDSTFTKDIIQIFKFSEFDCKIPLPVTKTDNKGKFEIDWKWFPDSTAYAHTSETGTIIEQIFNYGTTGEIVARKFVSETQNSTTYLLGRQDITIDKSQDLIINLTVREVVVHK